MNFQTRGHDHMHIKASQNGLAKFITVWSGPHKVVSKRGVVITLREITFARKYITHHDRLSNYILWVNHLTHQVETEKLLSRNAYHANNLE